MFKSECNNRDSAKHLGYRCEKDLRISYCWANYLIGKKDVTSILLPTRDKAVSTEEKFESLPISQGATSPEVQRSLASSNGNLLMLTKS